MPEASPHLTIGIVAYGNSPDELRRLLRSCETAADSAGLEARILVIDNAGDLSAADLEGLTSLPLELFPHVGNIGFGRGHNLLMAAVLSEGTGYYIATNPDGFFHPQCIARMIALARTEDDFALVEARQFPQEHPKVYDEQTLETPWCSGACLLVTGRVYAATGGFDEGFFMYCEDVDLSWRARLAGAKCMVAADAFFFHDVTQRASNAVRWHMGMSLERLASRWIKGAPPRNLSSLIRRFRQGVPRKEQSVGSSKGRFIAAAEGSSIPDFSSAFSFAKTRW